MLAKAGIRKAQKGNQKKTSGGTVMRQFFITVSATAILLLGATAARAVDPCLACHEKNTPSIVKHWKASAHFLKKVTCTDCHGTNIDASHNRTVTVNASTCGACHAKALTAHQASKHGIGLKSGMGCSRNMEKTDSQSRSCALCHRSGSSVPLVHVECAMFLAQTPEMQRQGCSSCHRVEIQCDTCHTKHGTDLSLAQEPGVCGVCHMGPDHPQQEMWETSPHGVLYKLKGKEFAPSCVGCHMRAGSHNVSKGIASGLTNTPKTIERAFMLGICADCHTKNLAARNLADGDRIEEQSRALVTEAQQVIEALQKDGLLFPAPSERKPHPIFGSDFVIGPHMLYENLSFVESLFFKMKSFYAITAYKGVFHQNPDYAHWYGNAPLKLTLSEIKSEAALLRRVEALRKRIEYAGPASGQDRRELEDIRKQLRELNEKRLKGLITDQEYEKNKMRLLDEKGL